MMTNGDLVGLDEGDRFPGAYVVGFGGLQELQRSGQDGSLTELGTRELVAPFASVTKLVTSLAVMVAVQEEIMALSEPVGPFSFTVADLLGHASGLAPDGDPGNLDGCFMAPPQSRRIYSNLGYELLALLLESASQMPFAHYATEAVLRPLGMAGARYEAHHLLPGGRGGATGLVGSLTDLLALVRGIAFPGILDQALHDLYSRCYLDGLGGVLPGFGLMENNRWGLGPEIAGTKSPHWSCSESDPTTYGHFGRSGSLVWVDPVAEIFLVSLSEVPFGSWAVSLWPTLARQAYRQYQ
jgi:CubicO group peptidase (beta-lactamase class C family)